jgi:hypothetical protein
MKGLLSGLIALLLTFGGGYFYGKYVEREVQQAEVDRLNTEARAKEQALAAAVTTTAEALRKTNEKAKLATKQRDAAIDWRSQAAPQNDLPRTSHLRYRSCLRKWWRRSTNRA